MISFNWKRLERSWISLRAKINPDSDRYNVKILTKIIVIGDVEFRMARVMNVATLSAVFFEFISQYIMSCAALFS